MCPVTTTQARPSRLSAGLERVPRVGGSWPGENVPAPPPLPAQPLVEREAQVTLGGSCAPFQTSRGMKCNRTTLGCPALSPVPSGDSFVPRTST